MMDQKCCDNCDKCACSHGAHGMMMDCCQSHSTSKEHLEAKKKMLEEKLKHVTEELAKVQK